MSCELLVVLAILQIWLCLVRARGTDMTEGRFLNMILNRVKLQWTLYIHINML